MTITITFPGGVGVDATMNGHTVHTDQPAPLGHDSAMSPLDLFFASIGACMGYYALRFCQQREIETEGLSLKVSLERDAEGKKVTTMRVALELPPSFPARYVDAIRRSVEHCSAKRHLIEPPAIELTILEPVAPR